MVVNFGVPLKRFYGVSRGVDDHVMVVLTSDAPLGVRAKGLRRFFLRSSTLFYQGLNRGCLVDV